MADEAEEDFELEEFFKDHYFNHLNKCRSIMIGDSDPGDEFEILLFTVRRTQSTENIWDLITEDRSGNEFAFDTINVSNIETSQNLLSKIAKASGIELSDDEGDEFGHPPDSPAFG